MPDNDLDTQVERMLDAAMGGMTPHQLLLQQSLADKANETERAAAIAKNRERALTLLAEIEKSQARTQNEPNDDLTAGSRARG